MREAATAGRDEFVTKTDLDAIRANLAPCATRTDLAALEARMYRALSTTSILSVSYRIQVSFAFRTASVRSSGGAASPPTLRALTATTYTREPQGHPGIVGEPGRCAYIGIPGPAVPHVPLGESEYVRGCDAALRPRPALGIEEAPFQLVREASFRVVSVHRFDERSEATGTFDGARVLERPGDQPETSMIPIDVCRTRKGVAEPILFRVGLGFRSHDQQIGAPLAFSPFVPPEPARALDQQIDRGQVADQYVEVQIERLLDDLRRDQHLARAFGGRAVLSERLDDPPAPPASPVRRRACRAFRTP